MGGGPAACGMARANPARARRGGPVGEASNSKKRIKQRQRRPRGGRRPRRATVGLSCRLAALVLLRHPQAKAHTPSETSEKRREERAK